MVSGALIAAFGGPTGMVAGPLLRICGGLLLQIWGQSSKTPSPLSSAQVEEAVLTALSKFAILEATVDQRIAIQNLGTLLQIASNAENITSASDYDEVLGGQASDWLSKGEDLVSKAFIQLIPALWARIKGARAGIINETCPDEGFRPFKWPHCPVNGDWDSRCMTDFTEFASAWSDFQRLMILSMGIEQVLDSIYVVGNNKIMKESWDYKTQMVKWEALRFHVTDRARTQQIIKIYKSLAFFQKEYSCTFTANQSCAAFNNLKDVNHVCHRGQLYLPGCQFRTDGHYVQLDKCGGSEWSAIGQINYPDLGDCHSQMATFVASSNVSMSRGDDVPACPSFCTDLLGIDSESLVCWRPDPCLPGDCMKWIDEHDFSSSSSFESLRPAPGYTTYLKPASGGASGTSNASAGHLRGANPSNPCESLSVTDPAQCPMTHGASGAAINTAKTCVYSPACAASGGLDCFEQTGCKYK